MNLLDTILSANNGALVKQLAQGFGINENDARNAVGQLLPALTRGISRNAAQPGGMEALLKALTSGSHQRYVDRPEELTRPGTVADGNAILGHILGSKDVSRNVAGHAAAQTGVGADILKQMLPVLAATAMGFLSKQAAAGSPGAIPGAQSGGQLAGLLGSFLDADKDGSVVDDLLGLAKKFF